MLHRPRQNSLIIALMIGLCLSVLPYRSADAGRILKRIQADGVVRCGVTASGVGLSEVGVSGRWEGFFVDFCRALASAVLDDPDAVEPVEVDDIVRFQALANGAFDVLMANTTWTIGRDTALGITFADVLLYDGQGFLAHRSLGAESLAEVESGTVCVPGGTTTVKNLSELTAGLDGRTWPLPRRRLRGNGSHWPCDCACRDRSSGSVRPCRRPARACKSLIRAAFRPPCWIAPCRVSGSTRERRAPRRISDRGPGRWTAGNVGFSVAGTGRRRPPAEAARQISGTLGESTKRMAGMRSLADCMRRPAKMHPAAGRSRIAGKGML